MIHYITPEKASYMTIIGIIISILLFILIWGFNAVISKYKSTGETIPKNEIKYISFIYQIITIAAGLAVVLYPLMSVSLRTSTIIVCITTGINLITLIISIFSKRKFNKECKFPKIKKKGGKKK